MYKKKWMAAGMAAALVVSMTACKSEDKPTDAEVSNTPTPQATATVAPTPTTVPEATATVAPTAGADQVAEGFIADFEDGNAGFVMMNAMPVKADSGASFELADVSGSKAVKVTSENAAAIPFLGIDVSSLAGDKISDVRSIEFDIGVSHPDGAFYACSGNVYTYTGEENKETAKPWSVYLESKNPKHVTVELEEDLAFVAGAKNIIVITKEVDNGFTATGTGSEYFVDNFVLKDKDGNPMELNTSASFDAPDGFGSEAVEAGFSENAISVMQTMCSADDTKTWQYQYTNLQGQEPFKYIMFQLVGEYSKADYIGGGGSIGFNYGDGEWHQVDFEITGDDNFYTIEVPAEIAAQIDYSKEGMVQIGYWWGSVDTCTLTKVEFASSLSSGGKWSSDAITVMQEMNSADEAKKTWQCSYADLAGQEPFKQIVFELSGDFSSAGYIGGGGSVGFNYGDGEWYQADFEITEDTATYVIDVPADLVSQIDFSKEDGIVQIGFWWGSVESCTLTKVDFRR